MQNVTGDAPLRIFPNPAALNATVVVPSMLANSGTTLRVFGLNGRMVYETQVTQERTLLDVSVWSKGMYLVELTRLDGQRMVQRLAVH